MPNNLKDHKQDALGTKIRTCDPFVAKTLADYYEDLLDKNQNELSQAEKEVMDNIEAFCRDKGAVQKRELDAVIQAVNAILDKKDTEEWTSSESAFLKKLESLVFLKLNGTDQASELDQLDKYVESLLRLEFPKSLPTFSLANNKRNIFNYFSLSLESIAEKIKESTISAKAVNNMMQYLTNTVMIVTDNKWNIRYVGSGDTPFFDKDAVLMIDDSFSDYIENFKSVLKGLEKQNILTQLPAKIRTNLYSKNLTDVLISIIPNESAKYSNGEQDEIEEYVIKLDINQPSEPKELDSASNSDLIQTLQNNLSTVKNKEESEEWNILNSCIEQLLELKSKKENLLVDEKVNYSGGVVSLKEIIDITALVKQIASDLEDVPGFDEMVLVLEDKKATPLKGYYDMIYSVIRHIVNLAVKFRKIDGSLCEIVVSTLDVEKYTCIRIKDNGLGMPESWISKIFDEDFFKPDNHDKKSLVNGLHFVKKTVERMNGKVELFSAPNEGSTFTILIPQ